MNMDTCILVCFSFGYAYSVHHVCTMLAISLTCEATSKRVHSNVHSPGVLNHKAHTDARLAQEEKIAIVKNIN